MSNLDQAAEQIITTAAEFGYTREQVLAWTRADLIRFDDELTARVEIERAGLAFAQDLYRQQFGEEPPTPVTSVTSSFTQLSAGVGSDSGPEEAA